MNKTRDNTTAVPTGDGAGPDAIRGLTYHEIQREQDERDRAIRRRKPGLDVPVPLAPGEVPRTPNVWSNIDREPPDPEAIDALVHGIADLNRSTE